MKPKRNILFLHSSSDLYGADRSLIRTVEAVMDEHGIIVCLPYDGPLVNYLEEIGCTVQVFNLAVIRRKYFNPIGVIAFAISFFVGVIRLLYICRKQQVELIHSNTTAVMIGGITAKLIGIPHLWHVREIIVKPIIIRKFVSFMLGYFSQQIIGVSQSTIENLALDQSRIRKKSVVINNGIDLSKYNRTSEIDIKEVHGVPKDRLLVGMIGRVSHWKGQDLFVEIAERILKNRLNVHFMAIGSPFKGQEYLMNEFENQIQEKGINSNFTIVPFTSSINDYILAFDLFILPSTLPDPFPTTVLEAMATRRAIVANGHGGAPEMIEDSQSGYVVKPPNSVDEFVEKISILLEDPNLRKRFGKSAFVRVREEYNQDKYMRRISSLFARNLK